VSAVGAVRRLAESVVDENFDCRCPALGTGMQGKGEDRNARNTQEQECQAYVETGMPGIGGKRMPGIGDNRTARNGCEPECQERV